MHANAYLSASHVDDCCAEAVSLLKTLPEPCRFRRGQSARDLTTELRYYDTGTVEQVDFDVQLGIFY